MWIKIPACFKPSKEIMKRVASFLLAVLLCFLEGCGLTDTQDIESSEGNSVPWTTNSPNEGTGSLEQENYILQHLDYLEGDECRKVLSVKGDLAGQASRAYEESNHAKINKLWTTISDVCMLVGKNEIEMDNEYDVLLTDLMQSTASEENFEESYVEAYCAAVKELLSGLSGIMKNEEDAFKLLSGSAVNKVADLTESIDHWFYVLQEAEGKDKKNILPLYDSVLKNLKKSYDEALGSKGKEFLSNAREIMNYVCDIADLTSDSFSDLVDEYLFYCATSEATEEWYMTWKQIAEQMGKPILSACLRQALLLARQKHESRVVKTTSLRERSDIMGSLSKYEQETVINFDAGEQTAVVYT